MNAERSGGAAAGAVGIRSRSVIFLSRQAIRHRHARTSKGEPMNEDHIIAAILASGKISAKSGDDVSASDAVALYFEILAELIDANRPKRDFEAPAAAS